MIIRGIDKINVNKWHKLIVLNKQLLKNIFSKHLISFFDGKDFVRQKTQDINKMCYFNIQDKLTALSRFEYNFPKEIYLKKYTDQYIYTKKCV